MFENVFQQIFVVALELAQRFVEAIADIILQMANGVPAGFGWHEESILILAIQRCRQPVSIKTTFAQINGQCLALLIEQIAASLQKQNAENILLILRRLHIATEFVAGLKEQVR
jgi:hypothetical protein